jgi:hypothetical protein
MWLVTLLKTTQMNKHSFWNYVTLFGCNAYSTFQKFLIRFTWFWSRTVTSRAIVQLKPFKLFEPFIFYFESVISVIRFFNFGISFTFLNYGICKKWRSVPCRFLGLESVWFIRDHNKVRFVLVGHVVNIESKTKITIGNRFLYPELKCF